MLKFILYIYIFLNYFDILILKIKFKTYYFNIYLYKIYFKILHQNQTQTQSKYFIKTGEFFAVLSLIFIVSCHYLFLMKEVYILGSILKI